MNWIIFIVIILAVFYSSYPGIILRKIAEYIKNKGELYLGNQLTSMIRHNLGIILGKSADYNDKHNPGIILGKSADYNDKA